MAHEVYVGVIKDRDFAYSGEPESWRQNIELVADLGTRAGPLADFTMSPEAKQVDWATFIRPVTYQELLEWFGPPRREVDVTAYRPFMPGQTDDEIRETMKLNPRKNIEQLRPDRDYVLVSVEGL